MKTDNSIRHIIFDLSEVIIFGLSGFTGNYSKKLGINSENEYEMFGSNELQELLRGSISEENYLQALIRRNRWDSAELDAIKELIRSNFHKRIPGTLEIAVELSKKYELSLLSDHAKEWVEYINEIHPFISNVFSHVYYSCFYGMTKREVSLFKMVIRDLNTEPGQCLFIDDSERNIQVASMTGLKVIHFKNHLQFREELERRGLLENQVCKS